MEIEKINKVKHGARQRPRLFSVFSVKGRNADGQYLPIETEGETMLRFLNGKKIALTAKEPDIAKPSSRIG